MDTSTKPWSCSSAKGSSQLSTRSWTRGTTAYTSADPATDGAYPFTWPSNVVGRVVQSPFTRHWQGRAAELRELAASYSEDYAILGDRSLDPPADLNWAGESAGLIDAVLPAAEIVRRTVNEAEALLRSAASRLQ